jgi:hypothetical protein
MNTKIFALITKNLRASFNLAKHEKISADISENTLVDKLPWTPARYRKFCDAMEAELHLKSDYVGSVSDIVADLDRRYSLRFFGEVWMPRTDDYVYTGWNLAEEITKQDPKNVLDVGCGYHPFRGRIPNIIGIDPYNSQADYQVDILEYRVKPESHDHIIALGSINFNSRADIEARFGHCVDLLMPGGKFYLRANPGITHKTGPYVDIFPWSFEVVHEFAEQFDLRLLTFKRDNCDRLYFAYEKPSR